MSLRRRLFHLIARLVVNHPWLVLAAALALSAVAVFYTRQNLEFHTGQGDLISGESRDSLNYLDYTAEFPDLDGLVIAVRADRDPYRAERFADDLGARLGSDHANVKSVFYRMDPEMLAGRALLYLDRKELQDVADGVRQHRELLARYAEDPRLQTFFRIVNEEANRAMMSHMLSGMLGPSSPPAGANPPGDGLDLDFLDAVLEGMVSKNRARPELPWDRLAGFGGAEGVIRDGYLGSENGKYLLMQVAPGEGVDGGADVVDAIQAQLDAVRAQDPDVEAGMTGSPALARAEERATAHDIALASVIAIVSNALLVIIPFASLVEPAFALTSLLVGVAWSFGFTTLAVGHLNLLSAVFTSILAGIGINFSIHLMARYDEARRAGNPMRDAVELAVVNTGTGVVASASIMALAFLMPIFTDFRGIAELGLVSSTGLFLCLVSAMFVFPALIAIRDRNRPSPAPASRPPLTLTWLEKLFVRPRAIVVTAAVITAAGLFLVRNVGFDLNLLRLQADDTEAVTYEMKLLHDAGRSSWFAVSLAETREEAEVRAAKFRKLPEVSETETIANYIPGEQAEKRALLATLRPVVSTIRVAPLSKPSDPAALDRELSALSFKLGGAGDADPSGGAVRTGLLIDRVRARLKDDPGAIASYEVRMAEGLGAMLEQFKRGLSAGEITEHNLPPILRERFVGNSGRYLVQIYPRGDVWGDASLKRFVTALRTVDPDVTGPPVQTFSIATVMREGYERAALFALIGVVIFVLLDFRNLRDTALAAVPLLFGGLWLLETMGAAGWEFNLASLFAVPILIGTAVDNGVNLLYRWREESDKSQLILSKAVGKSVTVCSLTTIAGFAALIPASHRGISSLGWTLAIGVTLVFIATMIVLPALFELFGRRQDDLRRTGDAHGAPPHRRRASGVTLVVLCTAAVLAATGIAHAAGTNSAARETSNRIVAEAETMIIEAGRTNPPDTAKLYSAVRKLEQATEVDPTNDAAYIDLGFCYGALRDRETAIEMYEKAVKLNPSADNYRELANVYLRAGDAVHALMAANAGLEKNPDNASLYNAKGMALHDQTRFDEAIEAFKLALKYDPNFAVARANLELLVARTRETGKSPAKGGD